MKITKGNLVVYPESADIVDVRTRFVEAYNGKIKWLYVSPLHDSDVKEDGTPKKEHLHLVFSLERDCSTTTKAVATSVGLPENLVEKSEGDQRHAVRYLVHADQPDKAPYNAKEILTVIGTNASVFFKDDSNVARAKAKKQRNDAILADLEKFTNSSYSPRQFITDHPEYLFNPSAVLKLADIWRGETPIPYSVYLAVLDEKDFLRQQVEAFKRAFRELCHDYDVTGTTLDPSRYLDYAFDKEGIARLDLELAFQRGEVGQLK